MSSTASLNSRLAAILDELKALTVADEAYADLLDDIAKEARRIAAGEPVQTGKRRSIEVNADYVHARPVERYEYVCSECGNIHTAEGLPGTFRKTLCDKCAVKRRRARQAAYQKARRQKST